MFSFYTLKKHYTLLRFICFDVICSVFINLDVILSVIIHNEFIRLVGESIHTVVLFDPGVMFKLYQNVQLKIFFMLVDHGSSYSKCSPDRRDHIL
jgi:hypothetical protein